MKKNLFTILYLRSYAEVNPGGTDCDVDAVCIFGVPERDTGYALMERSITMGHPPHYLGHFYRSEEDLLAAFWKGLESVRNPPPEVEPKNGDDFIISMLSKPESFFADHPGFVRTIESFEFNRAPWFLAEEGDILVGDIAITPDES